MAETDIEKKEREDLLVMLEDIQRKYGYLPADLMSEMAETMDMSLSEVYGVASFYSFLTTKPEGRYLIRLCKSVPCYLQGAETIAEFIEKELKITPGEMTEDGRFSLQMVNCIGACDQAPAMLIDDDVYGNLTPERIREILGKYK